jgi:transcriptional regulator with XRE-family HTH domain
VKRKVKKVRNYSIDDLDQTVSLIQAMESLTEEAIAERLGYSKGYISQTRSRKTVPEKFMKALQREWPTYPVTEKDMKDLGRQLLSGKSSKTDEILVLKASVKVLMRELAKLQAKVGGIPFEQALEELGQDTSAVIKDILEGD